MYKRPTTNKRQSMNKRQYMYTKSMSKRRSNARHSNQQRNDVKQRQNKTIDKLHREWIDKSMHKPWLEKYDLGKLSMHANPNSKGKARATKIKSLRETQNKAAPKKTEHQWTLTPMKTDIDTNEN